MFSYRYFLSVMAVAESKSTGLKNPPTGFLVEVCMFEEYNCTLCNIGLLMKI